MLKLQTTKPAATLEDLLNSITQDNDIQKVSNVDIPANTRAEQILIGALLLNNELLDQVNDFIQSEHFYEPIHQKIHKAILALIETGLSASPVSLQNMLHNDKQFQQLGESYLATMTGMAMTVVNVYEYGRIVYDLALRRKLITIGQKIISDACKASLDYTANQQIEAAESQLFGLAIQGVQNEKFVNIKDCVNTSLLNIGAAMRHEDKISGISTGFKDLDNMLSGLHNSDLLIIAGRPGMGKTTFALNLAANVAKNLKAIKDGDRAVGIFSLEMPTEQLARKLLAMQAQLGGEMLISGKIDEGKYNLLKKASETINEWPIFIDDSPALSITAIRTRARRLKRKHNLGALFIDYLQLIQGVKRLESRVQEVSEITQGLKALAKELDIPIIALSQLSRAVEQRNDKRPMLSDLRESGSIEQDCDIALFIYRKEYYIKGEKPQEGSAEYSSWFDEINKVHNTAEIIIAKHRNGPTGSISLYYDGSRSTFANYVHRDGS